jgi:ABC-type multidrug transport system fused ATPase/permease subunit
MLQTLLWILIGTSILFLVIAAVAYVVVRFVFVRLAERISTQIAAQIDRAVTDGSTKLKETLAQQSASRATMARAIDASAVAGNKIRDFAAARGLNVAEAKLTFFDRLDKTARLMDRAIPLPLIGGVGLDALLGLIPFIGDAISACVAGTIILNSLQYGLPKEVVAKMVANMFVDVLFGAIPVLGDLFDVVFKANTRNVALLRAHLEETRSRSHDLTSGGRIVAISR